MREKRLDLGPPHLPGVPESVTGDRIEQFYGLRMRAAFGPCKHKPNRFSKAFSKGTCGR